MSGYWHTWGGGPGFIRLSAVEPSWDVINIAFAVPVTPGSTDGRMAFSVTGDASYTDAMFKADIKALQAKGKKIVLAIGGYEGYFSLTSASAATTFANAINGFISAYGFDGIDIDMEQTSVQLSSGADADFKNPTSPKVVYLIQALKSICAAHGANFILSFAPETMYLQQGYQFYGGINMYVDPRCGDYIPVIYALGSSVTYVQAQLYNSGAIMGADGNYYSMGDQASIVAMCKMVLTGFNLNQNSAHFWAGLRPDQVVIGVPAASGAAGSGLVANSVLQSAFTTLNNSYPGLRGIMAWSINWDNFMNANSFAKQNRAYLNTLP
jgi:chitinase